ncbi:MAG: extracellular solute-binding protein [Alicyclobacillus sp.]|nr:extracellular solute-binding protein [Alicyclobacillus sp.]
MDFRRAGEIRIRHRKENDETGENEETDQEGEVNAMRKRTIMTMGLAALTVAAAAGCQTNTAGNPSTGAARTADKQTIVLWDNYTDPGDAAIIKTIISKFEAAHPGIVIQRTAMTVDNERKIIKPALQSGKGPDIFYYDAGPGYMGVLAKDGLLLDLTGYAKQHGWYQRFPAWILHSTTVNGHLYGVGNEVQALGVFYNKAIFRKYHLSVPRTYGQFLHDCQVLKAHGVTPLEVADKDQWPGFHLESAFYTAIAGRQAVQNVLDLKAKAGWNQPVFAKALDDLRQLVVKGYTNPDPLAVSYDDGNNAVYAGKAAMTLTGSWMVSGMYQHLGQNAGFFPLPPADPHQPDIAPGGLGGAMLVSAKTRHAQAVEQFLDYMFSEKTASVWLSHNMIPPVKSVNLSKLPGANPLFKEVVRVIDAPQGMSYSLDVRMPQQVNDVTQNDIQRLLAGQMTGAQVVADKQSAFQEAVAAGDYY